MAVRARTVIVLCCLVLCHRPVSAEHQAKPHAFLSQARSSSSDTSNPHYIILLRPLQPLAAEDTPTLLRSEQGERGVKRASISQRRLNELALTSHKTPQDGGTVSTPSPKRRTRPATSSAGSTTPAPSVNDTIAPTPDAVEPPDASKPSPSPLAPAPAPEPSPSPKPNYSPPSPSPTPNYSPPSPPSPRPPMMKRSSLCKPTAMYRQLGIAGKRTGNFFYNGCRVNKAHNPTACCKLCQGNKRCKAWFFESAVDCSGFGGSTHVPVCTLMSDVVATFAMPSGGYMGGTLYGSLLTPIQEGMRIKNAKK
jgi:hypothetical protein